MTNRALRVGRAAAALVVAGTALVATTGVSSGDPVPIACDVYNPAGLHVEDNGDGTFSWTVKGTGVCSGGFPENYTVSISGHGTSEGNGLCTGDATSVVLNVTATFANSSRTLTQALRWNAPIAPGVEATPFLVSGDSSGAGTASSRIFLKCSGSGGTDAARFIWTQRI